MGRETGHFPAILVGRETGHFPATPVGRETGHFPATPVERENKLFAAGMLRKPSQQIMLRNASYQLRVERLAACLMENYQI